MKTIKIVVLIALLALLPVHSRSVEARVSSSFSTGKDWKDHMTEDEKLMSLMAPMIIYHRYGVPFILTPEKYIPKIDKIILKNPDLGGEDVANIFASTVYAIEPESRHAWDALEEQFLRGDYTPGDLKLTIRHTVE